MFRKVHEVEYAKIFPSRLGNKEQRFCPCVILQRYTDAKLRFATLAQPNTSEQVSLHFGAAKVLRKLLIEKMSGNLITQLILINL